MPEPVKIESYHCPVCKEDLVEFNLEKARTHVNVPLDETRLPVGLFYIGSDSKNDRYYFKITANNTELDLDHSFVHNLDVFYYPEKTSIRLHYLTNKERSYRHIIKCFQERTSRLLSQKDFDDIFSNPENSWMSERGSQALRTCPELEALTLRA